MHRFTAPDQQLLRLLGERGGLLTAAEAAVRTGLPLETVEPRLLALAAASGADLRVATDGTLAYRFPRHLRRRLLARSWRLRLQVACGLAWQVLFAAIRFSFGLVLLLLLTLVSAVLLVFGAVQLLRSDDGVEVLLQLLVEALRLLGHVIVALCSDALPSERIPAAAAAGRRPGEDQALAARRLNVFDAVHSVLFGDGDPNRSLERRRWVRVGCFLRHRGGAVIAEDLAPLLDLPPPPSDPEQARELADRAMLPVLQRFDGRPEVSDSGDLLYHFPSLQLQAAPSPRQVGGQAAAVPGSAPGAAPAPPLRERRIPFSRATGRQRSLYGTFSGSLLLLSPLLLLLIQPLPLPLLWLGWVGISYGTLLLLVPLLRALLLGWRNRRIARRNSCRRRWLQHAVACHAELQRRRAFAQRFAGSRRLEDAGLAYTTESDLLEQQLRS
ncbi:MAG: hypothetical protein VKK62_01130 [Synechococcaceae cyanobacterium]|nr:hypothetical protein [Synechococcaceae cyanobacterium]